MGSLEHISALTDGKTLHRLAGTQNCPGPPPNRTVEWPSDTLVVPGAVLDPSQWCEHFSCAAHKLQAVVFPCRAAVLRGSLTCSCDNISVPPFVSDHRERDAEHKYGYHLQQFNSETRFQSHSGIDTVPLFVFFYSENGDS